MGKKFIKNYLKKKTYMKSVISLFQHYTETFIYKIYSIQYSNYINIER